MGSAIIDWLPIERLQALHAAPLGELWVALGFFALTASIYASGVPGTLLPLSFSSGALLGGASGMVAVGLGALIGSVVLYTLLERSARNTLRHKYERHLGRLEGWAAKGGILPLIGLRLAGLPHLAVTGLCALSGVGPRRYVLATAIGILPAIALTSIAGATI